MTKNSGQTFKYLKKEDSFKLEIKTTFHDFKGLPRLLESEGSTLKAVIKSCCEKTKCLIN